MPLPPKLVPLLRACACAVFTVPAAWAATFYVSSSDGDDANPGVTVTAPWRSLAKVNASAFSPGDQILFKRGDTWTMTGLVASSDGAPERPITFGAYGAGPKPVLTRSPGEAVLVANRRHIVVENLALPAAGTQGIASRNSNFVTIRQVDVADNGRGPGIVFVQGGNLLIDGCTVTNASSNGILFKGSLPPNRVHDGTVQNCVVRGTKANDGIVLHNADTVHETVGSNFVLRHNRSEGNREQGFDLTSGSDIVLEGNTTRNNLKGSISIGHQATRVRVRYHRAEGEPTLKTAQTIKITVPDVVIEYSVLVGSSLHPQPLINIMPNARDEPDPENVTLRNNTLVWNHPSGGNLFSIGAGVLLRQLTLKNNLWISRTAAGIVMNFAGVRPPGSPGFHLDHNLYHGPVAATWRIGGTSHTFARYQDAFGCDRHGAETDPLLVDPAGGDFHLGSAKSPARDAGENIGPDRDFDGVPVPQGVGRDVGAYEFPAGPLSAGP